MSIDERPVALPKLYGAPAYARPPIKAPPTPRPFDPDQMPLQVYQTEDERRYAGRLRAYAYGWADGRTDARETAEGDARGGLRPRLLHLRAMAGRLLGGD